MFRLNNKIFILFMILPLCASYPSPIRRDDGVDFADIINNEVGAPLSRSDFLDNSYLDIELSNALPCSSTNIQAIRGAVEDGTNGRQVEISLKNTDGIQRNAVMTSGRKWSESTIPYTISSKYNRQQRSLIAHAMEEFHKHSCIRFVERHKQADYVFIHPGDGCSSIVGRMGGPQPLSLSSGCMWKSVAMHELMHAIGFSHEHTRPDRDDNVRIVWENIIPKYKESGFGKVEAANLFGEGYDYNSIMHYESTAFSKNGQPTIIAKRPGVHKLGQSEGFTNADIRKISKLYCSDGDESGADDSDADDSDGDYSGGDDSGGDDSSVDDSDGDDSGGDDSSGGDSGGDDSGGDDSSGGDSGGDDSGGDDYGGDDAGGDESGGDDSGGDYSDGDDSR